MDNIGNEKIANETIGTQKLGTEKLNALRQAIQSVIVGQTQAVELVLASILADGHILLEGVPGVAKTLMARYMAALSDVQCNRIQFTPDLMPSDILGTEVYDPNKATFNFHKGPVFAEIVIADEINRAPAKTQAALFEVMEERQVTIAGITYRMSPVFTIIATQNPIENEGTYRLPEAQLDRFICKVVMGYPNNPEEMEILKRHHNNHEFAKLKNVTPILSADDLLSMRRMVNAVIVDDALLRYITNITGLSRASRNISLPASPRAAVDIMNMAKARAVLQGRDFATPDDVRYVTPAVLAHRLQLSAEAEMQGVTVDGEIHRLLANASVELDNQPPQYSHPL